MVPQIDLATERTVLFADLTGSTALYERLGDKEAFALVKRCLAYMAQAVEQANGRVVKITGDGIMAVFWDTDSCAEAVMGIHQASRSQSQMTAAGVGIRLGFCFGPVIESEADVFGDTVNMAARLCELGSPGIALMTLETATRLNETWRHLLRQRPPLTIKGISRPVDAVQLLCDAGGSVTSIGDVDSFIDVTTWGELRLYLKGEVTTRSGETFRVTLGRDPRSDLVVSNTRASRNHCEIGRQSGKFVLIDRSSNGTYVTMDNEAEFKLYREETVLQGHGFLSFGQPRAGSPETVEFFCS